MAIYFMVLNVEVPVLGSVRLQCGKKSGLRLVSAENAEISPHGYEKGKQLS
jgi:hypothetical protein